MFSPHRRMYYTGFMLDCALAIAMTAMPFFVYAKLHGSEAMSGAFGGSAGALYAFFCVVFSRWVARADNILHYAVAGMAVYLVLFTAMVAVPPPWVCGLLYAFAFGAMALVWPALQGWIGSDPDPELRKQRTGWFNVSWSLGMSVGPLLAGPLIDLHYALSFVAVAALTVISLGLVLSLPHEKSHFAQATDAELEARAEYDRASEAHLWCAWLATMSMNCLMGLARNVYPKRVENLVDSGVLRVFSEDTAPAFLLSHAATIFSWLAFVLTLASAAAFFFAGQTTRWRHNFWWLAAMQWAAGVAFWVLGHTHSLVGMLVAFAVFGVANGMAFFTSLTYSLADPAKKYGRATLNEAMVGLGGFLGSSVAGTVVAYLGFERPFHAMPLIVIGATVVQGLLLRRGLAQAGLR